MGRRGKRTTLARGIYRDASGIAIVIRDGGKPREVRDGLSVRMSLDTLKGIRARLQKEANTRGKAGRGLLNADITRYLALVTLAGPKSIKAQLTAWAELYPGIARHQLTPEHVLKARKAWLQRGDSPKIINHRVHRLRRLYRVLDGHEAWSPCDGIPDLPVPRTPIVRTETSLVTDVVLKLEESERLGRFSRKAPKPGHVAKDPRRHRARLMVIALHGKRPSEVMRAKPDDVNLALRVWVPRDGKGGYTPGIYLNDEMLVAWKLFAEADAWGPFSVSKFDEILGSHGWPVKPHETKRRSDGTPFLYLHPRPYNLRHTTAITLSEAGHDLADISPMLGHKQIETTRRHYAPVLNSRMQQMSETLEGRFGWARGTKRGTEPVSR
jgi:integrase